MVLLERGNSLVLLKFEGDGRGIQTWLASAYWGGERDGNFLRSWVEIVEFLCRSGSILSNWVNCALS